MDNELQKAVGYIPATDFEDYNDWLGMMGNFKAAGLTLEDFTHWSSASPKHTGDEKEKWDTFPSKENRGFARIKLLSLARKYGYVPKPHTLELPPYAQEKAVNDAQQLLKLLYGENGAVTCCPAMFDRNHKKYIPNHAENRHIPICKFTPTTLAKMGEKVSDGRYMLLNGGDGNGTRKANIKSWKWALVENDTLPIIEQYARIKNLTLPLVGIVHSGGKSLHCFISVDATSEEEYTARVKKIYDYCTANNYVVDCNNRNSNRFCRFPLSRRGEGMQYPIEVHESFLSYQEWETQYVVPAPIPASIPASATTNHATANGWGELCQIEQMKPCSAEFPLSALPPFLAKYVDEVAHSLNQPQAAVASAALAMCSIALKKNYMVRIKQSHELYGNLYMQLICGVAYGKTPLFKMITEPLEEVSQHYQEQYNEEEFQFNLDKRRLENRKKTLEADLHNPAAAYEASEKQQMVNELRTISDTLNNPPKPQKLFVDDITVEKLAIHLCNNKNNVIAQISGEARKIFENIAGGYTSGRISDDVYLKAHSGDTCAVSRINGERELEITRPIMQILTAVQPDTIRKYGANEHLIADGFLSRFLYVIPEKRSYHYSAYTANIDILQEYHSIIVNLMCQDLAEPHVLPMPPETLQAWIAYQEECSHQAIYFSNRNNKFLSSWYSKNAEQLARISLILAVLNQHQEVLTDDLDNAKKIMEYFKANVQVFSASSRSSYHETVLALLRFVERCAVKGKLEFTIRAVHDQKIPGLGSSEEIKKALKVLEEHAYVKPKIATTWEINPIVSEISNSAGQEE